MIANFKKWESIYSLLTISLLPFITLELVRRVWLKRVKRYPLPPGPPQRLFIGNTVDQLPGGNQPWVTYASWSKIYGPVIHTHILNRTTVFLNSAKAVVDLLESRSSIYSSRPRTVMTGHIAGRKLTVFGISFLHPRFKTYRKLLNSGLNPRAATSYRPIQQQEARILLKSLLHKPENFVNHIRTNAAAIILKVTYGYDLHQNSHEVDFVKLIEDGFELSSQLSIPRRFALVEAFPFLRFLPSWFPGASFKRLALRIGRELDRIDDVPFKWAKETIASGNYVESFMSKHLQPVSGKHLSEDEQDTIKYSSAALYVGGADTTVSALVSFIYIMATNPEVQKHAQAEVDSVINGRLPTFDDLPSLPYVKAVLKETLRWGSVAPLGLRHSVIQDDVYEGYRIPKGSTVIANIWAITHDEEVYPKPMMFKPERHLGDHPETDPFKFVFGFGRRVCPGSHLAEMSLMLTMSSILVTFDVRKALDADGKEIDPPAEWSTGVTSHLKPFPCWISPRSADTMSLLE
ncbi:cytochrome P450 [Cyathus striatus]|nr:cytochrome P450 [Cyathus striatus]